MCKLLRLWVTSVYGASPSDALLTEKSSHSQPLSSSLKSAPNPSAGTIQNHANAPYAEKLPGLSGGKLRLTSSRARPCSENTDQRAPLYSCHRPRLLKSRRSLHRGHVVEQGQTQRSRVVCQKGNSYSPAQ